MATAYVTKGTRNGTVACVPFHSPLGRLHPVRIAWHSVHANPMGYANMRFATGIVDRFLHRLDTEQTLNGRACMQGG